MLPKAMAYAVVAGVPPVYGLAHPAFFRIPYVNVHAMKIGAIRAHPRQAMEAARKASVRREQEIADELEHGAEGT